jgi:hypothetical protein
MGLRRSLRKILPRVVGREEAEKAGTKKDGL